MLHATHSPPAVRLLSALQTSTKNLLSAGRVWPFFLILFWLAAPASAQDSTQTASRITSPEANKKRLRTLLIGGGSAYAATLAGLNFLWYADSPRGPFRFFNDNAEWKQVDKVGHAYTAYHISRVGVRAFEWTGMPRRKSIWLGGLAGMAFQTPIEIMDGFSAAYGASWGDLAANTAGSGLLIGQLLWWDEERIHPKFSFRPTALARLRPNMLGANLVQQIIKDYNGQTYWLAFEVKPWLKRESKFPAWLCVGLGYGAQNMVYANDAQNRLNGFDAYRAYYLSLDVNFAKIPTRRRWLKNLFFLLNTVRVPAPTLEWNRRQGFRMHALYF